MNNDLWIKKKAVIIQKKRCPKASVNLNNIVFKLPHQQVLMHYDKCKY